MKAIAVVLCFIGCFNAGAQSITPQVINTNGGFGSNSTFSLSWSVGEAAITTLSGSNNTITQGFLQADPTVSSIMDASYLFDLSYYPNPVSDFLYIKTDNKNIGTLMVFDMFGKRILNTDYTAKIELGTLSMGVYLVKLQDLNRNILYTFKINKI